MANISESDRYRQQKSSLFQAARVPATLKVLASSEYSINYLTMKSIDHRAFKDRVFEQFARIAKAMASPKRLEIIDLLAQGERSVEELARLTAMSVPNVSRHLQVMRAARMVDVRREGLFAYYRLADEGVFRVWAAIRELGEARLTELEGVVREFLQHRSQLEP